MRGISRGPAGPRPAERRSVSKHRNHEPTAWAWVSDDRPPGAGDQEGLNSAPQNPMARPSPGAGGAGADPRPGRPDRSVPHYDQRTVSQDRARETRGLGAMY